MGREEQSQIQMHCPLRGKSLPPTLLVSKNEREKKGVVNFGLSLGE